MKKILFSAAIGMICFFISCKDSSTTSTADNSANEKSRANSKAAYTAMETGDVSKLDSIMDKDIIDHGDMGDAHGIDTVKKMFMLMHNQVKDLKMEPIAEATDGDYHFSYVHMTGTTADASMGLPVGTKLDFNGIDLVKLKDGKAVEHWSFSQGKDMMKMMNMNPDMKPCMDKMMMNMQKMNGKMEHKDSSKM